MISIIREEKYFLVVNKPAGLFSQAAADIESLESELTLQIKQRDAHLGNPFIGLPHRLDRATSGVMLIARNQRALKRFGQQFQSRKVGKFYLAVVEGSPDREDLQWEDYLRKVADHPLAEIVSKDSVGAKLARLDAFPVVSEAGRSLLLIQLHTGRMHQIRIQAASRGLPVVGDCTYGAATELQATPSTDPRQNALALHALRIEFRHPQSGLAISGTAPLPAAWTSLPSSVWTAAQGMFEKSSNEPNVSWQAGESLE